MENYVNYNSDYAADVFDNYNGLKPVIPETPDEPVTPEPENPDEPTPDPDTPEDPVTPDPENPEDPVNPSEDDNQEQPVETAGLRDLLRSVPIEENTEEEVVEEPKTTTRSRKSKK
jgi:hypothetical protein